MRATQEETTMDAEIREAFAAVNKKLDDRDGKIFELLRIQAENASKCQLSCARETVRLECDINGLGKKVEDHVQDCAQAKDRWWAVKLTALGVLFMGAWEGLKSLIFGGGK